MSKRELPAAPVSARAGLRSEILPSALAKWNPDVRSAKGDEEDATISILDPIGADWFGEGVTAKRVCGALRSIGKKDVTVTINSPGGEYFEGLAIYNLLRDHPAKVTVKIVGIAASPASMIAMAGDEIQIARAGFLMIHNTWVFAMARRQDSPPSIARSRKPASERWRPFSFAGSVSAHASTATKTPEGLSEQRLLRGRRPAYL